MYYCVTKNPHPPASSKERVRNTLEAIDAILDDNDFDALTTKVVELIGAKFALTQIRNTLFSAPRANQETFASLRWSKLDALIAELKSETEDLTEVLEQIKDVSVQLFNVGVHLTAGDVAAANSHLQGFTSFQNAV